ncbi:hypothetical protein [Tenacibaculum ovolyticum]|uniref:hypothetical protein n=1 Tax=Tenacibaculum ovolyticum TaxID=104270 RepID=UPI001F463B81|nr:hypothetical protein [Tenacibaculum ovolyticum]
MEIGNNVLIRKLNKKQKEIISSFINENEDTNSINDAIKKIISSYEAPEKKLIKSISEQCKKLENKMIRVNKFINDFNDVINEEIPDLRHNQKYLFFNEKKAAN